MCDHTLSGSEIKYILKEIRHNKFFSGLVARPKIYEPNSFSQTGYIQVIYTDCSALSHQHTS